MKEAFGDLCNQECDALVITTNGFVKTNGEAVMGRGIAKQIANHFPELPRLLGNRLKGGNQVYTFGIANVPLITFPVKDQFEYCNEDKSNVVRHMQHQFSTGSKVAGWACKARIDIILTSAHQLVELANQNDWKVINCPRFGCGAGELRWEEIKPLLEPILDDRFVVYTF